MNATAAAHRGVRQRAKAALKPVLTRVAPRLMLTMLSIRSRRFIERQTRDLGLADLARRLAAVGGSTVQSGPFAGMRLDVDALSVHIAPKLIGTYESELHTAIEMAVSGGPDIVLNIGCAEGYYAVGLALRLPEAMIHAFDAEPKARWATARNAALNGVGNRLQTAKAIRAEGLERFLRLGKALVVMDCEGAEADLLDPSRAPSLVTAHILVELHPSVDPEAGATLISRFAASHMVHRRNQVDLKAKLASAPPLLSAHELEIAVDERRGPDVFWLCMTRR